VHLNNGAAADASYSPVHMADVLAIGGANPAKHAVLILGTAQLGLPYGAANSTGLPPEDMAIALIRAAVRAGVTSIETARAYGDSERRIGLALGDPNLPQLAIVTKLDPMAEIPVDAPADQAVRAARASLAASREALRRDHLNVLLLHRAAHRTNWGGAVWDLLRGEREASRIGWLGVSVQSPSEAQAALEDPDVRHIQLPYNLLDRRWEESGAASALRRRSEVVVHARSILLQGLLAGSPQARWPVIPGVSGPDVLALLTQLARDLGRSSLTDLCIAFVRAQDWINGVTIGMETMEQLNTNLACFERAPLGPDQITAVRAALPSASERLLDPAQWPNESAMRASS
jgi:aryl-alcohol dehydrogenase-like predicted oxidoreductase